MLNQLSTFGRINTPCLYFIGLASYWFYDNISGGHSFNFFALGIIAISLIQMFKKNKALGLTLGLSGIILSCLMFIAVWSEFSFFKTLTESTMHLLLVGSILSLSTLCMSILLMSHYAKMINT